MIPPADRLPRDAHEWGEPPEFTEPVFRSRRNLSVLIDAGSKELDRRGRGLWPVVAVGAFLMAVFARPAFSDTQCDARDRVVQVLLDRYGETQRAMRLAGEGALMELYASNATGTWTMTITLPDGQMCLVASGQDFIAVPALPAGSPT